MKTNTNIIYLLFAFVYFALSPPLKAQCPSACGAGGNTGVGDGALDSVTTGINNTAVGKGPLTSKLSALITSRLVVAHFGLM